MSFSESLQHAVLTDVGMRRTSNQDAHAVIPAGDLEGWMKRGHLFIVADGMGGHAGGELASKLTVEGIPHLYQKHADLVPPEAMLKAVQETNAEVHRRGQANVDFRDMGTTCSLLLLLPQGALAAHIGDSRVYRLRGDSLEQLTFDHSVDWELRASGALKEGSELAQFVPKNQITRSLGPNPTVQPDFEGPYPLEIGDTFLLCSDGLVRKVEDDEIGPILAALPPKEAARALVDLANVRGGPDNITVIVAKVAGPELVTKAAGGQTLVITAGEKPKGVHPFFWLVVAVCFLAAVVLAAVGQLVAGGVAALGGLIGLIIALLQPTSGVGRRLAKGQRLGRGPYTQTSAAPKPEFLTKLFATAEELREATEHGEWEIDWAGFRKLRRQAEQQREKGDWQGAVKNASGAISFLLQELRAQSEKRASDSTIEY